MSIEIKKRDGRLVPFDITRIEHAIKSACNEVGTTGLDIAHVAKNVEARCYNGIEVEAIQDLVETELMSAGATKVAKAYILFREERNRARTRKQDAVITSVVNAERNDVTRENANSASETPAGMMMKVASENSKEYASKYLISEDVRDAVKSNILHIHDFDYYLTRSLTCLQHPVNALLSSGFKAGHGESRSAKRIETASILSAISMETIQNEMHGGQAIPAFDFYMAPYVRKTYIEEIEKLEAFTHTDLSALKKEEVEEYIVAPTDGVIATIQRAKQHAINMTVNRVHQAMEAFLHNMNTIHSRGGNQVVFSSINYGTDTSAEGRCVMRELLNSTYRGVGNGSTAIFPIQIWKKKRGVNFWPEDKNYDLYQLACKVTARRFFPNFLNLDAPFNTSEKWDANDPNRYLYEVATMGCRTRVFENRFSDNTSVGRGNLSFSTINLPGLALMVRHIENREERKAAFISSLNTALAITCKQLRERYEFQCQAMAKQFPLLMSGMWMGSEHLKPNDEVRSVLKHGTLGIGFIGLAECLVALIGKHHGEDEEAQRFGVEIIKQFRDFAKESSDKYDLNFSVLATPAEGLSGKFTKKDKKKFGIIPGITDRDYYTNSNHVPVYYKCSAAHKAEIEAPYHDLTRGGHIFYVELDGDATHNVQAVQDVVTLMDKHNIGYGSINHNRNRCMDCGYEDASSNLEECPCCDSDNIDKLQRITGYLVGTTDRWNSGKLAELNDRVTHD